MTEYKGTCLCGGTEFRLEGEMKVFYLCHCSRCRKSSGSAHNSNIFLKDATLTWLKGEDLVNRFRLENTRFEKGFCTVCGCPLPIQFGGNFTAVPAGSLDSDIDLRPRAHIHCSSRANWDHRFEDIEQIAELPPRS